MMDPAIERRMKIIVQRDLNHVLQADKERWRDKPTSDERSLAHSRLCLPHIFVLPSLWCPNDSAQLFEPCLLHL